MSSRQWQRQDAKEQQALHRVLSDRVGRLWIPTAVGDRLNEKGLGGSLDRHALRPARSGAVRITCPIHQGLIPQAEHRVKRSALGVARREARRGASA